MKKTNSTTFAIGMFLPQEKAQQGIQVWLDTNWTLHPAKTIRWCQQKKKNKNVASYLEYIMVVGKYIIPCFLSFILVLSKIVWCTYIYHHDTRLFSPCCPTFHQLLLICERHLSRTSQSNIWFYCSSIDGNKVKRRISKRVFQENKARQIFWKTNIS